MRWEINADGKVKGSQEKKKSSGHKVCREHSGKGPSLTESFKKVITSVLHPDRDTTPGNDDVNHRGTCQTGKKEVLESTNLSRRELGESAS